MLMRSRDLVRGFAFALGLVSAFLLSLSVGCCKSSSPVMMEFVYYDKFCASCLAVDVELLKAYKAYIHNCQVLMEIKEEYGENVIVRWIYFYSEEGLNLVRQFNLTLRDWNSVIVNRKIVFAGGDKLINKDELKKVIESQLSSNDYDDYAQVTPTSEHVGMVEVAVTSAIFGFFESFSPCVIVMLFFIVGYTLSNGELRPLASFLKVMTFSAGFLFATMAVSLACVLATTLFTSLQFYLGLVVSSLAMIFGLHLIGALRFPEMLRRALKRAAKTYVLSYSGIFVLGALAYFLDPCLAPLFTPMAVILHPEHFTQVIIIFCSSAALPFIIVGVAVSSLSKVAKKIYSKRFLLRKISGAILMAYAIYFIASKMILALITVP